MKHSPAKSDGDGGSVVPHRPRLNVHHFVHDSLTLEVLQVLLNPLTRLVADLDDFAVSVVESDLVDSR